MGAQRCYDSETDAQAPGLRRNVLQVESEQQKRADGKADGVEQQGVGEHAGDDMDNFSPFTSAGCWLGLDRVSVHADQTQQRDDTDRQRRAEGKETRAGFSTSAQAELVRRIGDVEGEEQPEKADDGLSIHAPR